MKISVGELVDSANALAVLSNVKVRAVASFKIAKVLRVTDPEIESYVKIQNEKIKEYGSKNKEGNYFCHPKEHKETYPKFEKEMEALRDKKLTLSIKKIAPKEIEEIDIQPAVLSTLDWLFDD